MRIPLFPLDVVLFPGAPLQLHIFEERYKEMIAECIRGNCEFGIVRARRDGLAIVGCTAVVLKVLHRYADGRMDVLCRGQRRFEIESLHEGKSFFEAEVDFLNDDAPPSTRRDREQCAALHMEMIELSGGDFREFPHLDLDQPIAFRLASAIPADVDFKQEMLQIPSEGRRTRRLMEFYETLLPKLRQGAMGPFGRTATPHNGHLM